jgi:hypothetical protein
MYGIPLFIWLFDRTFETLDWGNGDCSFTWNLFLDCYIISVFFVGKLSSNFTDLLIICLIPENIDLLSVKFGKYD